MKDEKEECRPPSVSLFSLLPPSSLVLGVAMTLAVRGYRFGESNHAVYLIDALRRADPALLNNDWWAQSTLQYHFVFNALTAALMRLGLLEPAFLVGYLALAVLLHVAWRKLVLRLGGTDGTYVLSVVLYYLLAGGVGLGMYQFLQDSSFLPSNIANVAMLWGMVFWIAGRPTPAGICLGVAGLFHINHALAGMGLWFGASVLELRPPLTPSPGIPGEGWGEGSAKSEISNLKSQILNPELDEKTLTLTLSRSTGRGNNQGFFARAWLLGTLALLALCAVQIIPALRIVLSRTGKLPLDEFVDLFVRFRHPHHFDPRAWHWGVWLSFLLPVAAVYALRTRAEPSTPERRRAWTLFALFMAMLALALAGAGFRFVSETLIQLNLYRFSIYPKLLGCVALAWLLRDRVPRGRAYVAVGTIVLLLAGFVATLVIHGRKPSPVTVHNLRVAWVFAPLAVAALALTGPARPSGRLRLMLALLLVAVVAVHADDRPLPIGFRVEGLEGDRPEYVALAEWARQNTPTDAVFLVPPDEESFRLRARRAIVVNFKGVPQLSAELPAWRDRLLDVLDYKSTADLLALPRPMGRTLQAIRARYDAVPPERLFATARKYGARYVVATHTLDPVPPGVALVHDRNGRYFLYDLNPEPRTPNPPPS